MSGPGVVGVCKIVAVHKKQNLPKPPCHGRHCTTVRTPVLRRLCLSARTALCACCVCLQGQHCVPTVSVCKDSTMCLLCLSARTAPCACCVCLQGQHHVPTVPFCKDSTVCLLCLALKVVQHWAASGLCVSGTHITQSYPPSTGAKPLCKSQI